MTIVLGPLIRRSLYNNRAATDRPCQPVVAYPFTGVSHAGMLVRDDYDDYADWAQFDAQLTGRLIH
jgi:hypothetical protein